MHRHVYKGKKLSRERGQRRALMKGLATSLVLKEKITTTKPKAKELIRYTERLIAQAKKGGLHGRRQVQSGVSTEAAMHKLVDELAPRFKSRPSGFISIKEAGWRKGDDSRLATVGFTAPTTAEGGVRSPDPQNGPSGVGKKPVENPEKLEASSKKQEESSKQVAKPKSKNASSAQKGAK